MKNQRQDEILKILDKDNFATVAGLSQRLYASLPTIRRDLSELEKSGLIKRSHGGAMSVKNVKIIPFDFRIGDNSGTKMKFSHKAAEQIYDGETIFIDSSSSCYFITEFLNNKKDLTVVTNSLTAAATLIKHKVKCYLTGGEFDDKLKSFVGKHAVDLISDFRFDKVFFSSNAVSKDGVITDYSEQETAIRKRALELAYQRIFLCDVKKFNKNSRFFVCDVADVDLVITDASPCFKAHNCIIVE